MSLRSDQDEKKGEDDQKDQDDHQKNQDDIQKVKHESVHFKVQDSLELEPGAVQYFWTPDTYLK